MKPAKYPWRKYAGEGMLIVASVFLAILLESTWQDHSDAAEARVALAQILQDLRADQVVMTAVLAEQEIIGGVHSDLLNWFENPGSLPSDSVHQAFRKLKDTGLTMWPRRAAWNTMVAAGQLRLLGDSKLVTHLGDHYEYKQQRLTYTA